MKFHASRMMYLVCCYSCILSAYYARYKSEIRQEDKAALRQLIKEQYHYQVTPEIHRELDASR